MSLTEITKKRFQFRAWDLKDEKMYIPIDFQTRSEGVFCYYETPQTDADYYSKRKLCNPEIGIARKQDCVLMQTTGFSDIDGKQIFEGDVVKVGEKLYQVVWMGANNYPAFDLNGWDGEANGICEADAEDGMKIVGNCYENPELIGRLE